MTDLQKMSKYQTDPEYRKFKNNYQIDRYWRKKLESLNIVDNDTINTMTLDSIRETIQNYKNGLSPSAKEKKIKYIISWYHEKYDTDPEFRKKRIENAKHWQQQQKNKTPK